MRMLVATVLLLGACASDKKSSSNDPVITGDTCEAYTDATACGADSTCQWLGTGCACPPNDPACTCSPGACESKTGGGSGSGSGTAGTACACPNGEVCYEQLGGTAQQAGTGPEIQCTAPAAGSGDPCARIQDQGHCSDSPNVTGLCLCDNGIR